MENIKIKGFFLVCTTFLLFLGFVFLYGYDNEKVEIYAQEQTEVQDLMIADLNGDGVVNLADFRIWVSDFRANKEDSDNFNERSDLNGDDNITLSDFNIWVNLWREYKYLQLLDDCPEGMIQVPPGDGGDVFCVDKYEAKQDGERAISVPDGTPWVSINQQEARDACIAAGKRLITEEEWLQLARNIEQVGWNWSGGIPGNGQMSDGHSDDDPSNALAASTDDNPCFGTNNECDMDTWHSQRRTYRLSNGEYIWDLGGNVWQWVDGHTENNDPYPNDWGGWVDCTDPDDICGNTLTTNDRRYGGDTVEQRSLMRGGSWGNGSLAGSFSISLFHLPTRVDPDIGFRCAL